jgi:HSP20 family protein
MFRTFDPFQDYSGTGRSAGRQAGAHWNLAYDVVRFEEHIEVSFDVPGIDPDSIDLTVEKGDLTLSATRAHDVSEDAKVITRGRPHGTFTKQLHIGTDLDSEGLEAVYDLGVLTLTIPVAAEAKARKVAIGVGSESN